MKSFDHQTERLESFTSIRQLFSFILHTYDGYYLVALSIAYFLWATYTLVQLSEGIGLNSLALFFYPVLLLVVYVRHRIGTLPSDQSPSIFSFVSLTVLALVPAYITFWR